MNSSITTPSKPTRKFLPEKLVIDNWEKLASYFEDLKNRQLNSREDLDKWLMDRSELEAVLEEDAGWRYIKMTIDTSDKSLSEAYNFFVTEIHPKTAPYDDYYNKKFVKSEFTDSLEGQSFQIYVRGIKKPSNYFGNQILNFLQRLRKNRKSMVQLLEHKPSS